MLTTLEPVQLQPPTIRHAAEAWSANRNPTAAIRTSLMGTWVMKICFDKVYWGYKAFWAFGCVRVMGEGYEV